LNFIDLDLQRSDAADAGAAAQVRQRHRDGRQHGEVLALVSLLLFDNNIFSGKVDEARLNQYLSDPRKPLSTTRRGTVPARSIFKQITGSAALQEGVASLGTTITSNGLPLCRISTTRRSSTHSATGARSARRLLRRRRRCR
jgi:cell division protein FtsI/penicillin-binding protein 2